MKIAPGPELRQRADPEMLATAAWNQRSDLQRSSSSRAQSPVINGLRALRLRGKHSLCSVNARARLFYFKLFSSLASFTYKHKHDLLINLILMCSVYCVYFTLPIAFRELGINASVIVGGQQIVAYIAFLFFFLKKKKSKKLKKMI